MWSGPTYEVPNPDLGSEPAKSSFVLTDKYRFDEPGKYTVRLILEVGLDDESTRLHEPDSVRPHFVSVTREVALEIVPASTEWEREVIRKGYEAFTGPNPGYKKPSSPEMLQYQKDTQAFCNLGTPEAVRALAMLLSQNHEEVKSCLEYSPRRALALDVMRSLQTQPDVAVTPGFFEALCELLTKDEARKQETDMVRGKGEDSEREPLYAAILKKQNEAQITSLATLLGSPRQRGVSLPLPQHDFAYDMPLSLR